MRSPLLLLLLLATHVLGALAQEVTVDAYARAERFLPWNADGLALGVPGPPSWIEGSERFWYSTRTADGKRFTLVDPAAGTKGPAFEHARLAAALSVAADTSYDDTNLPFDTFAFTSDESSITFDVGQRHWQCSVVGYHCAERDVSAEPKPNELATPNGAKVAFVREHDLWIKTPGHEEETRLTWDGEPFYDYGTSPEGNTAAVTIRRLGLPTPPAALWSPDGSKIATHRLDQRNVAEMHLVQSAPEDGSKRPRHFAYRYAHPGDSAIPMAEMMVIDVESGAVTALDADPLMAIYQSPFAFQEVWWSEDGSELYFIHWARGYKAIALKAADPTSGTTRTLIEESCPTYCEANVNLLGSPNVRILGGGTEFLWFSERDGWGHLYLYDGSGSLKRQITQGAFVVRDILHVDEERRAVYFTATGREAGRDPYYRHLYRASLDGGPPELLSPENADHDVLASPSGSYFFDHYSRADTIPMTVLRDRRGRVVQTLETGNVDALLATGWRWPTPFRVKARDGTTDLYGLLFYPTDFDSTRSYPIVEPVYPGPQITWVPKQFPRGLFGGVYWDAQATAELGFVTVILDGMGTPFRSKAFHNVSYGNLEDAGGLDDHITALKQLAARRRYLDVDRVGLYGFSGGGFMAAHAILTRPDFYKVAVSAAGNHDQRGYIGLWGEKYHGLLDGDNYVQQANATHAKGLEGKLLLVHGDMDDNVSPALTIQLVDALIKANRDFDLLIMPNRNHGFGNDPYFIRRRWDYFVQHLMGATPPVRYEIQPATGRR